MLAGAEEHVPFGISRLVAGMPFCLGLVVVIIGCAELFTGNTLIVMAWVDGRIGLAALLRNWTYAYLGNLAGALAIVALMASTFTSSPLRRA